MDPRPALPPEQFPLPFAAPPPPPGPPPPGPRSPAAAALLASEPTLPPSRVAKPVPPPLARSHAPSAAAAPVPPAAPSRMPSAPGPAPTPHPLRSPDRSPSGAPEPPLEPTRPLSSDAKPKRTGTHILPSDYRADDPGARPGRDGPPVPLGSDAPSAVAEWLRKNVRARKRNTFTMQHALALACLNLVATTAAVIAIGLSLRQAGEIERLHRALAHLERQTAQRTTAASPARPVRTPDRPAAPVPTPNVERPREPSRPTSRPTRSDNAESATAIAVSYY